MGDREEVAGADLGLASGPAHRVQRRAQEVHVVDPWDLHRVLEPDEHTGRSARFGLHGEQISPLEGGRATDLVAIAPRKGVRKGALARPVGAHHGVDLTRPDLEVEASEDRGTADRGGQILNVQHQPTLPSRLTLNRRCASTANSIGSSSNTSRQKPLTIIDIASSSVMPRWRQ